MIEEYAQFVWEILSGNPTEVLDNNTVVHNESWELSSVRTKGVYKNSRVIGSANFISSYSLLCHKLTNSVDSKESMLIFKQVLEHLSSKKLIRKKPELVRKTFKII